MSPLRLKLAPVVGASLLLALACGGDRAAPRPDGPTLYVLAGKGLNLRAEPDRSAAEVGEVPFGGPVVLAPEQGPTDTVSGMREPWRHVWSDGVMGWAFGGYLGPFRPPESCADLGDTVRELWGVEGEPALLMSKGGPGNRYEQWTAGLTGGARLEWVVDPDGGSDDLLLPGVSLNQAWNTLRRCVPEPEAARAWTMPTASKSCGDGCTVAVTSTSLRIEHAKGRGCVTRMEQVGADVRVSVSCGLDSLAPQSGSR